MENDYDKPTAEVQHGDVRERLFKDMIKKRKNLIVSYVSTWSVLKNIRE